MNATANQKRNDEAESAAGLCCDVWLECVIRIEHGWICIRNRNGWLLWSAKAKEVDTHQGVVLADITAELTKRQAKWQRDHDEMEREHSNVEVCESAGREKASDSRETQCAPSDSQH